MKFRGGLLWLKVALIVIGIPVAFASVNTEDNINNWRQVDVTVRGNYPEVLYGDAYHAYVTIKNVGKSPVTIPLDSECQVGYRLRDNNKKIIRQASYELGTCYRFDYNNLKLVSGEFEQVDFYVDDLSPGYYRIEVQVKPKETIKMDFRVLEPADKTSGLGEQCGGFPKFSCEIGLSCSYDGVLAGMPGVCVLPEYERENISSLSDIDYVQWERNKNTNTSDILSQGLKYKGYNTYLPRSGYVLNIDLEKYLYEQTGRDVDLPGMDYDYTRRDVAATSVYRTMIRNHKPESLKVYGFVDSKYSLYSNYIEEMARLNIIDIPESKFFAPDGYLEWKTLGQWVEQIN